MDPCEKWSQGIFLTQFLDRPLSGGQNNENNNNDEQTQHSRF